MSGQRRSFLKLGLGGAVIFSADPRASVWAQAGQGNQLLKLPKIALVIGNGSYKQSPLKNPANDAKGMAEALNLLGFEVAVRLDAGRASMQSAINAYTGQLASRKCVGLFYFAGHGVQINWKNYLLPVDAVVGSNEEVEAQGVSVNGITGSLGKAGNALNLIILDACRDAPFGEAKKPDQKGLSQMDSPHSTLLAYATAPGNVASDGAGANGLYTESLLREIRAADAKVEDVFKRVRLDVRRKSNGAQIPWESTSLEDDYYFVPPASLAAPSDQERERRFAEELKLWEKIESVTAAEPFLDYLRKYPSGNFSELAQFRLDRALAAQGEKRVEIAPQKGNPYTAGTQRTDTAFRVGDTYVYEVTDLESGGARRRVRDTVTAVNDIEVVFNNGRFTWDMLGNLRRRADGTSEAGAQYVPAEFAIGKSWISRHDLHEAGRSAPFAYVSYSFRIAAREQVMVPAGTFDCFRIEGTGVTRPYLGSWNSQLSWVRWMAPTVCRVAIKSEYKRTRYDRRGSAALNSSRTELVSFKQG